MQSGKPVGVFPTHADAPRVLIANSNLVPHWATWEHFHELDRKGLAMYGQMTAGSWIYIGSQGIVQGTYETFAEMGRRHFGGNSPANGYSPPVSAAWAARSRSPRPWPASACWRSNAGKAASTSAWRPATSTRRREPSTRRSPCSTRRASMRSRSRWRCSATSSMCCTTLLERGIRPDALTDQTSAHDPVNGYLPQGWSVDQWDERRASDPQGTAAAARRSMAKHVEYLLRFKSMGLPVFDYGNNIRQVALDAGVAHAFDFPGFVPEYIRPLFCRGIGPFRWVALSGDPEDIYKTDAKVKELIPDDPHLHHWLDMARSRIQFQGLPARICWVGLGQRHRLGLAFNDMVRSGELSAPDRDRPRSPGFRFRGQPESRDRGDAGWLGCGVRLAAAQCAAQHRQRRHLGVDSSRRRRRHGLFAARRRGHRLRRQRRRGPARARGCCGTIPAPA